MKTSCNFVKQNNNYVGPYIISERIKDYYSVIQKLSNRPISEKLCLVSRIKIKKKCGENISMLDRV